MKKKNDININMSYALTSLALVTMLTTGAILMSSKVAADTSVVDTASITVPVSCSMSGTGMTSHTATLQPGTYSAASGSEYENGIGTTTLTTFCNDYNGFSIYAIGYTGNSYGDNTLVGATTGLTIATKAYESTDTTSNWSMKVSKVDNATAYNPSYMSIDNSYGSWHAVPSEYTRVAHFKATTDNTSSATDTTLGGKVTTTYAAFVSSTQAADTYTGQVKYVMVHPYSSANPDPYAPTTSMTINDLTYMQDFAALTSGQKTQVLGSMGTGTQYQLQDSRDDKQYYISKLADGNVWMTQNLDHDIDPTYSYTNLNTDIGYNTSTSSYDTASWTPRLGSYTHDSTSEYEWGSYSYEFDESEYSWSSSLGGYSFPESYDPGELYWDGVVHDEHNYDHTTSTGDAHYHLGNYYNWAAAIVWDDGDDEVEYYGGYDMNKSICPAGWTLPKGGDSQTGPGSFSRLFTQYGVFVITDYQGTYFDQEILSGSPLYFVLGADAESIKTQIGYIGFQGDYWSSVFSFQGDGYANIYALALRNGSDNLVVNSGSAEYDGISVRCVAR